MKNFKLLISSKEAARLAGKAPGSVALYAHKTPRRMCKLFRQPDSARGSRMFEPLVNWDAIAKGGCAG